MFMFRKPGETSSSEDSSDTRGTDKDENTNASAGDSNLLSRVHTIGSGSGRATPLPSSRPSLSRNHSHVRELLLHSLLEEKTLREAAEHLGKDQSDPEVQELARTTYIALSRQLPGPTDDRYASELMRAQRTAVQEGLGSATRNHLMALTGANGGSSQAVVSRSGSTRALSALNPLFSSLPSPLEMPLQGYPGLHTDRYVREFNELNVVGKGGYGTVFKVQHKLDNSFYAVKRIIVSPARLQKIHTNGLQEMEHMLEEVRALAKFDHGNIVRYHNCWLEFTTAPPPAPLPSENIIDEDMLLGGVSGVDGQSGNLGVGFDSLTFDDSPKNQEDSGAGIVFEDSDADDARSNGFSNENLMPPQRKRSGSQATIATQSSARTLMSTIESVNGSDDEDIETIPRAHHPQYPLQSTELSESILSNSDAPNRLVPTITTGPVLTLNIQMSLYDTSLAAFLSSEQLPGALHHCFHTCISLELLANIISGVEYLHAQGVVHRDMKPGNVFMALSTSRIPPTGSIDVSTCRSCPSRKSTHVTPRIGDFGLVAALGDRCFTTNTISKPVGTEFYRPEVGDSKISEKLDVFALGVIAFEMLEKFSTRMERAEALTRLRRGKFPDNFADRVGAEVQELISHMVQADEEKRPTCEDVKHQLRKITEDLRLRE